jgi:hypothetical protein
MTAPLYARVRIAGRPVFRRAPGKFACALLPTLLMATVTGWLLCGSAHAQQDASIFKDADLSLGEKLIDENRCAACHIRKFGGDGTSIYRPHGRINTAGYLRGMVEQCNTELKMQLFPEEVTAIAAVLNRDFYRFK